MSEAPGSAVSEAPGSDESVAPESAIAETQGSAASFEKSACSVVVAVVAVSAGDPVIAGGKTASRKTSSEHFRCL